jgi:hypothetical protein
MVAYPFQLIRILLYPIPSMDTTISIHPAPIPLSPESVNNPVGNSPKPLLPHELMMKIKN